MSRILLDTGPRLAFCNEEDAAHEWATEQFRRLRVPLLTCEAVLVEAAHHLGRLGLDRARVLDLVSRGIVELALDLRKEADAVATLMRQYADQPMDLADGCLVRLSELIDNGVVFTLDGDFKVYRRHGKREIPLLAPWV
jgi:predicted nucleic acid-binding protein